MSPLLKVLFISILQIIFPSIKSMTSYTACISACWKDCPSPFVVRVSDECDCDMATVHFLLAPTYQTDLPVNQAFSFYFSQLVMRNFYYTINIIWRRGNSTTEMGDGDVEFCVTSFCITCGPWTCSGMIWMCHSTIWQMAVAFAWHHGS